MAVLVALIPAHNHGALGVDGHFWSCDVIDRRCCLHGDDWRGRCCDDLNLADVALHWGDAGIDPPYETAEINLPPLAVRAVADDRCGLPCADNRTTGYCPSGPLRMLVGESPSPEHNRRTGRRGRRRRVHLHW